MSTRHPAAPAGVAALLAMLAVPPAASADYRITEVSQTTMSGIGGIYPSLNNGGTVAFLGNLPATPSATGIYTGNGRALTTIAAGQDAGAVREATINDSGVVAFNSLAPALNFVIKTGNGGALTPITTGPGPLGGGVGDFAPAISNTGSVAFLVTNDGQVGGTRGFGVYIGNGGPLTTIALTTFYQASAYSSLFEASAQSRNGIVAYEFYTSSGQQQIFTYNNGASTLITSLPTTGIHGISSLAVNAVGQVAFTGEYASNNSGLFIANSSGVTRIVSNSSGPFGQMDAASINKFGNVAFQASLTATGQSAIFTGSDSVADKLIGTGDALAGSTIARLQIGRDALNDSGQIAFWALLANGQEGVFLATPPVVPEPSSMALLGLGGLGLLGYLARRRRSAVA